MEKEIDKLIEQINSDDWDSRLSAADKMADLDTVESTNILLDMLNSEDVNSRNLAAVAMRNSQNQIYFNPLIGKIKELGVHGQIGSLVYALEWLDCSRNLFEIASLNLTNTTNLEVKHSTTVILNKQTFILTKSELERVEHLLASHDFDMEGYDVKYSVI